MEQTKAKFYPKTEKIQPIPNELTLIGEQSPLEKARTQKGIDENFDEHGKFMIIDFIHAPDTHYEYDPEVSYKRGEESTEISEEQWNK